MAESIYEKAAKIIAERKEKRKNELSRRRSEVFIKAPRIKEIEEELDRYGIRMLNLIANGEYDEKKAVGAIAAENKEFVKERECGIVTKEVFHGVEFLVITIKK